MSGNVFIPKMGRAAETEPENTVGVDKSGVIRSVGQYTIVLLAGLLPIWFIPGLWASLGFDKTLLTIVVGLVVIITTGLGVLCRASANTILPVTLGLFWLFTLAAFASGVLSGDSQDALRGSVIETQTAGFLAVLGLAMTVPLILQGSKIMTIKALAFFGLSATLLLLYNLVRIIFGPALLSFGSFGSVTISPIGGFNDLAIFAGLIVILALVTLVQLPLKTWLQSIVSLVVMISLTLLAVVNFFNIWIVVGFFALLMLMYLLSRDTLFKSAEPTTNTPSRILLLTTTIVCVVSVVFIVAGDYVGTRINEISNINYVEVRPSVGATIDIARAVYHEDAFLGTGPNRFSDAWRQHKDRSINETIFWDTDFNAGSGFVPTLFITTGLLGGVLVVLFHLSFLYFGYRMLLRSNSRDSYWYYFAVVSFTAACFLWGMSYVYVPGAGVLLLAALFTGFTFVAGAALLPDRLYRIPLAVSRQRGFFLMAVIIVVISLSVGTLLTVGKQYVAQANFAKAQVTATSAPMLEQAVQNSYKLYADDGFISTLSQIQLANLNTLLSIQNPTEAEQQEFLGSADQALKFAEQALKADMTNPDYYTILAGVYSNLAMAGVDGARDRAVSALSEAERLDPLNPGYKLIAAQVAVRTGDITLAREKIADALTLKRNFTQALYLSAQIDISEGNTESAITTTQAIIRLEPQNPTRYFQLGVLLSAEGKLMEATTAFQKAVALDPQYANARYLLALTYLNSNKTEPALEQLRVVLQTNSDNQQLIELIQQVESGNYQIPEQSTFEAPVGDLVPTEGFDSAVITDGEVSTDLVTPVNTVSETPALTVPDTQPDLSVPEAATDAETEPTGDE